MNPIDPRTPVLIGVGQINDRLGSDDYQALSAVGLAAAAAERAVADAQASADLISVIDTVAGIRQFENSKPGLPAQLGRSNNYPRSVAQRLGAKPERAILEVTGGQGPQHLLTELAGEIAAGRGRVALLFGSEAISTARALMASEDRPDFTETVDGSLEDRGFGLRGIVSREFIGHGLVGAPAQYALLDNARRAKLGLGRAAYAEAIGALFAPFTEVAATNPYAAAPTVRGAEELVTVTEANRPIADPYTRYVVSRDQVNQGAALIVASVEAARELGVPEDRWVYLHGHADLRDRPIMDRPDLADNPAARHACELALNMAGLTTEQVASWDFYSCFPIAVFMAAVDGLGLSTDDPRRLTVTGGLPFFGGSGNNYSMHAIAETVDRARKAPGSFGFVGANGGIAHKYSTGVYSTTPVEWRANPLAERLAQQAIDTAGPVPQVTRADGWARIESFTISHGKRGRTGIVIGRLESTGERFVARTDKDDDALLALLTDAEQPVGERFWAFNVSVGNRATTTPERAAELARPVTGLRESYEHILVERDDHLLVITINRPQARNALFPAVHEELDSVFNAFFADPELWAAIITGAGERAFCSGNDLVYTASGKPTYLPASGFAGLTHRRDMHKPVIAAVNGFALGGGFEIALASHLCVADENAQFGLTEVKVGLIAVAGGIVRLPRVIPEKVALELLLTGRRMRPDEAQRLGLVNRIAPAGKALEVAKELAAEILANSPTSVRLTLELHETTRADPDVVDAVGARTPVMDDLFGTADLIEGMAAFGQKRPPQWRNQ